MKCKKTAERNVNLPASILAGLLVFLLLVPTARASEEDQLEQLKAMTLENLMQVTVFSASKKQEQLAGVSAAMHVITREDIRRSGARTLPDLLRGVPGLSVANMDAHTWAISSRGFNGLFANKLLVLMDGRTLYTPLYSGVYWDMQDTLLADIARIEIIRGPGATIWGANAVNGVINIITRKADDTPGVYLSAGAGTIDKASVNARYGHAGQHLSYRLYAKHLARDNFKSHDNGGEHPDQWTNQKAGFRMDWAGLNDRNLSVQGDIYKGRSDQLMTLGSGFDFETDVELSGGNLQLQWEQPLSSRSSWSLQTYLDRSLRKDGFLDQSRTTYDIAFNHNIEDLGNQDIVWGGGYRYTTDNTSAGIASAMEPRSRSTEVINLFLQDDIALLDEKLHLIIGSKMEHNDYTGYELQPTARMVWAPTARQSLWAAVSRAVRTPSRADSDLAATIAQTSTTVNVGPITLPATMQMNVTGNPNFESEELTAYELGYRTQPTKDFSVDIALFYNDFKNLRTQDAESPTIDSSDPGNILIEVPVAIANNMKGEAFGLEVAANWQVTQHWRLAGSYSWLETYLHHTDPAGDPIGENAEDETPQHQASLRSYFDLPHDFEIDTSLFYFSSFYKVPEHIRCDIRLGWNPSSPWEVSVKVENLFDNQHREFFDSLGLVTGDVPRNVYAELKYTF